MRIFFTVVLPYMEHTAGNSWPLRKGLKYFNRTTNKQLVHAGYVAKTCVAYCIFSYILAFDFGGIEQASGWLRGVTFYAVSQSDSISQKLAIVISLL